MRFSAVVSWLGWAADPFSEDVLDGPRSKGRPSAAGFAGRFAVLDTGDRREKIWLAIGAAARVWPQQNLASEQVVLMGVDCGPSGHLPSTRTRPFAHREIGFEQGK